MALSAGWSALQHCFSSPCCMYTVWSFYLSLHTFIKQDLKRWEMHKLRLYNTEKWNIFECLEHHHSAAVLLTSSTQPNFMLLTLPTQQTRHLYLQRVIWVKWKDLWLHPSSSIENKAFRSILIYHCIFWNTTTIAPIPCGAGEQLCVLMMLIIQLKLSGFSVLFLYHIQNWGSTYTSTRYFHVKNSLGKLQDKNTCSKII